MRNAAEEGTMCATVTAATALLAMVHRTMTETAAMVHLDTAIQVTAQPLAPDTDHQAQAMVQVHLAMAHLATVLAMAAHLTTATEIVIAQAMIVTETEMSADSSIKPVTK